MWAETAAFLSLNYSDIMITMRIMHSNDGDGTLAIPVDSPKHYTHVLLG